MQLSPKAVLALIVGLGLPVVIWAGWVLGDAARPAPQDGAGVMGNAPEVSTTGAPPFFAPAAPAVTVTGSAEPVVIGTGRDPVRRADAERRAAARPGPGADCERGSGGDTDGRAVSAARTTHTGPHPQPVTRETTENGTAGPYGRIMGLVFGILAALFYGAASVFQAIAAKRAPTSAIKAFMQPTFLVGLALDGAGFVVQFLALRTLPIFVVQACLAASLAVTAILAIPMLKLRLGRSEWLAIAAVCVGLALLGISAGRESVERPSSAFRIGLLVAVPVLAILGVIAYKLPGRDPRDLARPGRRALLRPRRARRPRAVRGALPAVLRRAGAVRAHRRRRLAFVFYTLGLQRASVTTVTAGLVIGETVLPSMVGVVALGDTTRSGFIPVAIAGFVIAIAASLMLARYGSLEEAQPEKVPAAR